MIAPFELNPALGIQAIDPRDTSAEDFIARLAFPQANSLVHKKSYVAAADLIKSFWTQSESIERVGCFASSTECRTLSEMPAFPRAVQRRARTMSSEKT